MTRPSREAQAKAEMLAREVEANIFAMELLMPTEFLAADIKALGHFDIESDPNLPKLAKRYHVSEQLMAIRIGLLLAERGAL